MKYHFFHLILNILFTFGTSVKVSIYYEALCPDSTRFIAHQLYPTYSKLKNFMTLEFIPYGKATHNFDNNQWKFECQHGKNECRGNKYQSCALQYSGNDTLTEITFVYCVMRARNPASNNIMEECAKKYRLDWGKISECGSTEEGDDLLAGHGNKTYQLEPNINFVPTVTFDDIFDQFLQDSSLVDLAAVVCSKISDGKPSFCDNRIIPKKKSFWDYFD